MWRVWPFKKRVQVEPDHVNFDGMAAMGEAFARSFAAQIDGNAKIAQVFSGFISQMGDLSVKQAARALGQRSVLTRTRTKQGKFLPKTKTPTCALCADPMTRNVSIESIRAHRAHEVGMIADEHPDSSIHAGPEVPTELGN